jgi:glycosyltransferase involved in cell wall biosynthesis
MTTLQSDAPAESPSRPRRRRVLISAIAVSPVRGSEPGIGWNIGSRVAKYHDVTLLCITHTHGDAHKDEIEAYFKKNGPVAGLTMLYVEPTKTYRFFDRKSHSLLKPFYYFGYASWQRAAYRAVAAEHQKQPFELTHHLNILGYREPGYLWKLPIPFFWGPVAGASNMPWRFFKMLSWRDRVAYGLRNIANEIQKRCYPRPRKAARTAAHIWAIGEDNRKMFTDVFHVPAECLCEAGGKPQPTLASVKKYDPKTEPLKLVFAGYHIGRKAVPLVLHAIAALGNEFPVQFTSLGTGPEKEKWLELARTLGIADKVRWIAELPQAQAHAEMAAAHLFAFPSLQEASSTVTLEALSLGLPVICHDACGMGFIVTENCGIKIPMHSPQQSIDGYANAMRRLHQNPAELSRLSQGALERSKQLSWDYAAEQIALGYDRVLGGIKK